MLIFTNWVSKFLSYAKHSSPQVFSNNMWLFSCPSTVGLVLTNRHMHAMFALVLRSLSRLPSTIAKQFLISQLEDLDL